MLRNLDDPLRLLNLLSLRSCGLVLIFYTVVWSLQAFFSLWSFLFGGWAFLVPLAAAGLLALGLSLAERSDDEHLVPSAIRYYLTRPWIVLYSGAACEDFRGHDLEWLLRGDGPR